MKAIREHDLVAAVPGKNLLAFRIQVFALGAALMALAGAWLAHYIQNISPDIFTPMVAIFIWRPYPVKAGSRLRRAGLHPTPHSASWDHRSQTP